MAKRLRSVGVFNANAAFIAFQIGLRKKLPLSLELADFGVTTKIIDRTTPGNAGGFIEAAGF